MTRLLYLHGLASGPGSKKAQYFREQFAAMGVTLTIPELDQGDFEHLTLTGQLGVIEREAAGQPVSLIGSSLGGYLAALYAARHPEVEKLVLMAPGFGFARRWPVRLGEAQMKAWEAAGTMKVFHYASNRECNLDYELIRDGAQYEEYPAVTQPCLIFHGRHDDVVPVQWSEEFAVGKPNVELRVEESDHELLNVTERMWVFTRNFLLG